LSGGKGGIDGCPEISAEFLPEWASVIGGNMVFAGETFFKAEETRGRAIAMGAAVFGPADVAMVFVNCRDVWSSAFGAG
jgi:hypothetical protein